MDEYWCYFRLRKEVPTLISKSRWEFFKYGLKLLSIKERNTYVIFMILQVVLAVLELLGILITSLVLLRVFAVVTPSATSETLSSLIQSIPFGSFIQGLSNRELLLGAFFFVTLKPILNLTLNRATYNFLASTTVSISKMVFSATSRLELQEVRQLDFESAKFALNDGLNSLIIGVLGGAGNFSIEILVFTILATMLVLLNPVGTITVLVVLFVSSIYLLRKLSGRMLNSSHATTENSNNGKRVIQDLFFAIKEIRLFRKSDILQNRYMKYRLGSAKSYAESEIIQLIPKYAIDMITMVGLILIAAYVLIFANGAISYGKSVIFISVMSRIAPSILKIQGLWLSLNRSMGYCKQSFNLWSQLKLERIFESQYQEANLFPDQEYPDANQIELQNVSYKYPLSNKAAVHDINLLLPNSGVLVIVGPSGSGKTTLANLLCGLYKPETGRVIFPANMDIPSDTAESIGYMAQEPYLINGTISQNITLMESLTPSQNSYLDHAIALSGLSNFVSNLASGVETHLGENSEKLSGGQKQRIALARVLFYNPKLVILDEPTSALDSETAEVVHRALDLLRRNSLVVVITHRLETIDDSDYVLEINDGQIVFFNAKNNYLSRKRKLL